MIWFGSSLPPTTFPATFTSLSSSYDSFSSWHFVILIETLCQTRLRHVTVFSWNNRRRCSLVQENSRGELVKLKMAHFKLSLNYAKKTENSPSSPIFQARTATVDSYKYQHWCTIYLKVNLIVKMAKTPKVGRQSKSPPKKAAGAGDKTRKGGVLLYLYLQSVETDSPKHW
jgi:hypothetical protein